MLADTNYTRAVERQTSYYLLVVEDNPQVLQNLTIVLGKHYQVVPASSVGQALAILKAHQVDLIVLDYCLPDGSGNDVLQFIARNCPSLPVIITTGYGSESLCIQLFRLGISDYFSKPYKVDELLAAIRKLLNRPNVECSPRAITLGGCTSPSVCRHPGIQRALSWIHTNYAEPMRLQKGARLAAISLFHFCRVFKVEVGLSFRQYINRLRVERAKELLRNTDESVTDITFEVGFLDLSHFYRVFRRTTGKSPCAWRRLARAGMNSNFCIDNRKNDQGSNFFYQYPYTQKEKFASRPSKIRKEKKHGTINAQFGPQRGRDSSDLASQSRQRPRSSSERTEISGRKTRSSAVRHWL